MLIPCSDPSSSPRTRRAIDDCLRGSGQSPSWPRPCECWGHPWVPPHHAVPPGSMWPPGYRFGSVCHPGLCSLTILGLLSPAEQEQGGQCGRKHYLRRGLHQSTGGAPTQGRESGWPPGQRAAPFAHNLLFIARFHCFTLAGAQTLPGAPKLHHLLHYPTYQEGELSLP